MMSKSGGAIAILGRYMQFNLPSTLGPINSPLGGIQVVRHIKKHWDPKFRKERKAKIQIPPIVIPKYRKSRQFMRNFNIAHGLMPEKEWSERPIYNACTLAILEPYAIPEGDGKFSLTQEAKKGIDVLGKKTKSYMSIRKIKAFQDEFSTSKFPEEALQIYKNLNESLANKNFDELTKYATEHMYGRLTYNTLNKTIHWKFLQSVEPARVVHVRHAALMTAQDIYAQVTVRFHTQQLLAIYDRFGRLVQGSEILSKDVLEYVVFENHLANEYGRWRIHGKLMPPWGPTTYSERTYCKPVISSAPDPETVAPDALPEKAAPDALPEK